MRTSAIALALFFVASSSALAQGTWDKTYTVNGKPSLQMELDDASVQTRNCGNCSTVRVHVDWQGQDPSHWRVSEMQGGNGIHFEIKRREEVRSWFGGGLHTRSPEVRVELPLQTDLTVHTGNGGISVAGLRGDLELKSGDGSLQADDIAGTLRLHTGNGSVQVHRAEGTLTGSTGDGSMGLEGRFSQVQANSGNGNLNVSLMAGSRLQASSSITTGNGSITLRVPHDLGADLQASTGSGRVSSNLPLASASGNDSRSIRGPINGGGPTLRLISGNGSISLTGL